MPNIMQDLGTKIGSEFKTHRLRIEAVETNKQENLVSGTNIKTINGTSVLGSGDIVTTQTTISGNAGTATKLQTARNIALTGDVTGNANFDGSGNISITATIAANSVALGTDTTGNYVAGITAGTGIAIAGNAGEGWSPTITLSNVGTAGTYTKITTNAQGQVTSGSTLTNSDIPSLDASKITSGIIDSARLPAFVDDVLEYATFSEFPNIGESGKIYVALDTNKTYRWSGSTYVYITSGSVDSVAGKTGVVSLVKDDVGLSLVDNTADASKNVLSATKLATARTIALTGVVTGSVLFDGSANASISATIAPNSVTLGTDTTGNYVAGNTAGTGITVTGTAGEGWSPTISLTNIGTAGTYRSVTTDAQGRVTAGTNPTTLAGYGITDAATSSHTHDTVDMAANKPGFMSVADAIKLGGIAVGANNYTLPVASTTVLGGVKAGANVTIDANGVISANDSSVAWSEVTSKPTTLSGYGITDSIQSTLVSGTNIKTINGTSILGSGDISISGGATLSDDTSTNSTYYPTFAIATSGNMSTAKVSSTKLTFNPSTGTFAATEFNSLSDVNKKENIVSITNGLEIINKLNGVEFDWKENGNHSSGVIAQELEKVLPFLVTEIEGTKTVNYLGIIGYLINAVQELSKNKEA